MLKADKPKEVQKMKELIEKHRIVALLDMHKLPGKQLQDIRIKMHGKAVIKMGRKTLIKKAIESARNGDAKELINKIRGEPALLLSNENPFELYAFLKKNKSPAAAKTNDIATEGITINKGSTNLPPGPAISQLQSIGLKTTVKDGKIEILKDKDVVKAGEPITEAMSNVLAMLKMEPMKIGLDMVAAWESGVLYEKELLNIDEKEYECMLKECIRKAINLSVNAGYITDETAVISISKAYREARSLALSAGLLTDETVGFILAKANAEADALQRKIGG
ncbi:MAG: 50S ribosomal protein L10 [Candidatus Aenigmarchaeota archaeon]|nr:50S ribosomal protein L10 [Candidatus Aenigmarchaeota archaeon]